MIAHSLGPVSTMVPILILLPVLQHMHFTNFSKLLLYVPLTVAGVPSSSLLHAASSMSSLLIMQDIGRSIIIANMESSQQDTKDALDEPLHI